MIFEKSLQFVKKIFVINTNILQPLIKLTKVKIYISVIFTKMIFIHFEEKLVTIAYFILKNYMK